MRAYLVVRPGRPALLLREENGGHVSRIEAAPILGFAGYLRRFAQRVPPGVYRTRVVCEHDVRFTLGPAVPNVEAEARRLEELAARPRRAARTRMPGVMGYLEREGASRCAQEARRTGNRDFARALREVMSE